MAEILLAKLMGPAGWEGAVVLKRALPHLARETEFREMFLDEARIMARIRHPNVVSVHELGQDGKNLFLVMEYLAGESVAGLWKRLIARAEKLDPMLAMHVVAECAAGLHAAHELADDDGHSLGVVHRDVSPQNVFLTYEGGVKLLDFGIARFSDRSVRTHTGHLKGKFAYMSPEQIRAEPLDRRSDVFALGILLVELATGRRLFGRGNELLVMKAICEDPIPSPRALAGDPTLPSALEDIAKKALARDRDERYASAADLRRDLHAVLRELDPERRAEERLRARMQELFADRIGAKVEMLRRVRAGDEITSIPSAEVDVVVEETMASPAAIVPASVEITQLATATRAPAPAPSRPSWIRVAIFAAMVTAAVVVGAALGLQRPAEPGPVTVAVTQPVGAPEPVVEVRTADAPPPVLSAVVRVHVESNPAGAEVLVDGVSRGFAPLDLELRRSPVQAEIAVRSDGYEGHVERIVPDIDQRLRVVLERERRVIRATKTGRAGRGSATTERTETQSSTGSSATSPEFFRFD